MNSILIEFEDNKEKVITSGNSLRKKRRLLMSNEIEDALMEENQDFRLNNYDKWMIWDNILAQWVVRQRKRYEQTKVILTTSLIAEALKELRRE